MTGALAALAVALGYGWGVHRRARPWPAVRTAAFAAGAAALGIALGPLEAPATAGLAAHMVQHLLIAVVAPALLAAGAPVRLALGALPRAPRRRLARTLQGGAAAILGRPPVALVLAGTAVVALHLPPLFSTAPVAHAVEHAALFWTALGSWIVVLGLDPLPHAPGPIGALAWVTAAMVPMAAVGAIYLAAPHALFAAYPSIADQRSAGTIMWIGGVALLVPAAVAVAGRALWREEQRQRRREEAAR
jgi:cytochrome c oxidase assembly factor CtaG